MDTITGVTRTLQIFARLKRKIADPQTPDSSEASSSKRRRLSGYSKSSAVLFPADKYLFCDKQNLKVKGEKEPLVKCITRSVHKICSRTEE